jgi:hypothetical protein
MGLDYHYSFRAPASVASDPLEQFLKTVEKLASSLGFSPTVVMAVPFDTPERQEFARRLTTGEEVQNNAFKALDVGAVAGTPRTGQGHILPEEGTFLVVTDECGNEVVFGFFRYPSRIQGVETGLFGWRSRGWVTSPDPRYRTIVKAFADAGYLDEERDEYEAKA